MHQNEPWYFDEVPAELYERLVVPSKFLPWAKELVALGAPQSGQRVLDVACGTGTVARLIPPLVGSTGTVVGLDFNAGRLQVAASLPPPSGVAIRWEEGDATTLPFADAAFDIVFCQQGLQFFPDKLTALREMRRVLIPDGKLVLGVWRSVKNQPGGRAMADALERHVSAEAATVRREPFSFGSADVIEKLVSDAGFSDVVVSPTAKNVSFPSAEAFTKRYISARIPLNTMVAAVSEQARNDLVEDVNAALRQFEQAEGLALPTAVNLVTASA